MASNTRIVTTRRNNKHRKANRSRKRRLSKKSTLSYQELFAAMGPPAQPNQG